MKKRNLIVANWKMNPENLLEAKDIFNKTRNAAKDLKNTDVVVCLPFAYFYPVSKSTYPKNVFLGVQNIATEERGAFTGEVSAVMFRNLGAKFSIIGHSERRAMGETDEMVRRKLEIAFNNNLTPILCIGEKMRDKEGTHLEFIKNQIKDCLFGLQKKDLIGLIIAYEPVWAIGKSYKESMSPTDIHETTLFIRKVFGELFGRDTALSLNILYGGSVEAENSTDIIRLGNVEGFLVGHASLIPEQFSQILKAADLKK